MNLARYITRGTFTLAELIFRVVELLCFFYIAELYIGTRGARRVVAKSE